MTSIGNRQNGLDLGRVIAVIVVIMIHLPDPSRSVINFAVPYFFVLSGYLLSRRAHAGNFNLSILQKFFVRHWKLFGIWALFYSALPPNWPYYAMHGGWLGGFISTLEASSAKLLMNPANFLLDGPPFGFHLWYLACAPLAAGIVFILSKKKLQLSAVILAFLCIGALLLLAPDERLGTDYWASNAKLGLLTAIPCICFGWFFALQEKNDKHLLFGAFVFVVGVMLASFSNSPALVSIAGIVLGIGLFVVLIAFPSIPLSSLWSALGQLSLGVYLIHIALRPIVSFAMPKLIGIPSWVGVALLTVLSFAGAFLLSKIPAVKNNIL